MKFRQLILLLMLPVVAMTQNAVQESLTAPDKMLTVRISTAPQLTWMVLHGSDTVLATSPIQLHLANGKVIGRNEAVLKTERFTRHNEIGSPFYKKARVVDHYNELVVRYKDGNGVIFRAYNDGVAYRFYTGLKDSITVLSETASFTFHKDHKTYLPYVRDLRVKGDQFISSFEALYDEVPITRFIKDTLAFLPVLVDIGKGKKAAILEADLQNYPGMYLQAGKGNEMTGTFAPYPLEEKIGGHNRLNAVVTRRAGYIARLNGTGMLPWRVIVVSSSDKELLDNDMVYKLSSPSGIADQSWIVPGKVAWDWWNDWNISGVDFRAGINTATYKHYIDFAAENNLEYIIMDEGWSATDDLTKISSEIDLKEIVDYAARKDVGVILWATWHAIMKQMNDVFPKYADMGIKGFKIDFLDRDDQKMVASTYLIAQKAAEHHLILNYHGMFKPAGLQRTYPNVVNFEGVKGLENVKWTPADDVPKYDVTIPFIRMLAGPMDYTPGAMRNASKWNFRAVHSSPMSQGTRCHQLAMYVIFEAPLQMLADNPTAYRKEQESTNFISQIPTTFDQTVALDGKVGGYVAIARRKGEDWFIGAMTNWDRREIQIDLSFLGPRKYEAEVFQDGINADRDATDYRRDIISLSSEDRLIIKMNEGGGWAARIYKVN